MILEAKYINHLNECIDFGANGIYINESDLYDFSWSIVKVNDKISSFKKDITKHTLPVVIICNTDAEGVATRNRLFEVCEKDVIAVKHGRIVIGDYYLKCFITDGKTTDYSYNKRYLKTTLTIQTDYMWVKESLASFNSNDTPIGKNLDYNRDHPYDYTSNIFDKRLQNADFVDTNFRMRIYGPCKCPEITIGGHEYSVDVSIERNEYLVIDSIEKTVRLYKANGSIQNCFNNRNRDSYIFQKIPPGELEVSTSSNIIFDITLLEERSVPKWT